MKISRQFNKQAKIAKIEEIRDKQQARYTKIREETKNLNKVELQKMLSTNKLSKIDRYAIMHTIMKIDESTNEITDVSTEHKIEIDGNTNSNNALSREDSSIQEEKS
jgi:hypothetical protein